MKKRKLFTVLLAASSLAAFAFAFTACGEHEHTFSAEWDGKDAEYHWHMATCEHGDEISGKAKHNWGTWETVKSAQHGVKGSRKHACTDCGYEATEETDALEHVWGAWEITKEPTESETGTAVKQCKDNDGGKEEITLPVLASTDYKVTDTADCTTAGKKTYAYIKEEGISFKKDSPALGHLAKGADEEWEHDAAGHSYTCGRCHESVKVAHTWDENDEECTVCGHARSYSVKFLAEDDTPIAGMVAYFYHDGKTDVLTTDENGMAYSDAGFEGEMEFFNLPAGYTITSAEDLGEPDEYTEYDAVFKLTKKTATAATSIDDFWGAVVDDELAIGVIYTITIQNGNEVEGTDTAYEYNVVMPSCEYRNGATYTVSKYKDDLGDGYFMYNGELFEDSFSVYVKYNDNFTFDISAAAIDGSTEYPYTYSFVITVSEPPAEGSEQNPEKIYDLGEGIQDSVEANATVYYAIDPEATDYNGGKYTVAFGEGTVVKYTLNPANGWNDLKNGDVLALSAYNNVYLSVTSADGKISIGFTQYFAPGEVPATALDGKLGEANEVATNLTDMPQMWFKFEVAAGKYTILSEDGGNFALFAADDTDTALKEGAVIVADLAAGTYYVKVTDIPEGDFTMRAYDAAKDKGLTMDDPDTVTAGEKTVDKTGYYTFTVTEDTVVTVSFETEDFVSAAVWTQGFNDSYAGYQNLSEPYSFILRANQTIGISVEGQEFTGTLKIVCNAYAVSDYEITVKDAEGNAIAGATVKVTKEDAAADEVLSAVTDANGKATLKLLPDEYALEVELTETQAQLYAYVDSVTTQFAVYKAEITLTAIVEYEFTVKAGDTAVEGVKLLVGEKEATTDANGVAKIKLPAGEYNVQVTLPDAYKDNYGLSGQVFTPDAADEDGKYAVTIALAKMGESEKLPLSVAPQEEAYKYTLAAGQTMYFTVGLGNDSLGAVFTVLSDGLTIVAKTSSYAPGTTITKDSGATEVKMGYYAITFTITAEAAGEYSFSLAEILPPSIKLGDNTVTVEDSYDGAVYSFTATEAGTYSFNVEGYVLAEGGYPIGNGIMIGWSVVPNPYTVELAAGQTINLTFISAEDGVSYKVTVTFTPAE